MSEQDFKRQLWCNVLTAGITGMANGQRIGANDCVYVADEMVKRYCDRFEPGIDQAAVLEAMTAEAADRPNDPPNARSTDGSAKAATDFASLLNRFSTSTWRSNGGGL